MFNLTISIEFFMVFDTTNHSLPIQIIYITKTTKEFNNDSQKIG